MIFDQQEIRALLKLAAPLALSQLVLIGMGLTDVLIAGRAGTIELAGMTLGNNVSNIIIFSLFGIGLTAAPLVSRHFGANDLSSMRDQIQQVIWSCLFAGIACVILMLIASRVLTRANFDPAIQDIAAKYVAIMSVSGFGFCMISGLRSSLESMNWTVPVLVINVCAFLINIPLDIILVNGLFGAPKLGGVGCAIATASICMFSMLGFIILLLKCTRQAGISLLQPFNAPNVFEIKKIYTLGIPICLSLMLELGFFCGAAIMIVYFGAISASAHAIAVSIASATYMIYYGISQAITIRASRFLGTNDSDSAAHTCYTGLKITLLISVGFSLMFILSRYQIVGAFSKDPAVISLAATLLILSAVFQFTDALQVSALCGLRAYLDTRSPLIAQFFAFWVIAFPLGYFLSYSTAWPALNGAYGYWIAMCIGLSIAAIFLLRKLIATIRQYRDTEANAVGI